MSRRLRGGAILLLLAASLAGPWTSLGEAKPKKKAGGEKLVFSITEARAYASRASLRKEVIEVAGLRDRLQPCDPNRDPYQCDRSQWAHDPNCPPGVAYGPTGPVQEAPVAEGAQPKQGGAGEGSGPPESPPVASPVTLNDLLVLGSMHYGASADARGLASDSYVDLSGRQVPEAHTETDAFAANARQYEERCWPMEGQNVSPNHVHVLSRSARTPSTYHYALCVERGCTFGGPFQGGAERGETIVDLARDGGAVTGRIRALVEDVTYAGGQLVAESIETVVTFRSDGTRGGLQWSVTSKASGVHLGGRPIALPPGEILAAGGLQVGMAAPHVRASDDGSALRIVAPGLTIAHNEQTAFVGGAELDATFGRPSGGATSGILGGDGGRTAGEDGEEGVGPTTGGGEPSGAAVGGGTVPGAGGEGGTAPAGGGTGPGEGASAGQAASAPASARFARTGTWGTAVILGVGGLMLFLLLLHWIRRYEWARGMYAAQPLRAVDWLYRAFVKG